VDKTTVDRLVSTGQIREYFREKTLLNYVTLLMRDDVVALKEGRQLCLSYQEALDRLGLNERPFHQLVRMGRLKALQGSPDAENVRWKIVSQTVEQFLIELRKHVQTHVSQPSTALNLHDAHALLQWTAAPLEGAQLLDLVARGDLTAYCSAQHFQNCREIWFLREDLLKYSDKICQENGWLTREEVCEQLNISGHTLSILIKADVVKPLEISSWRKYFRQIDITIVQHSKTTSWNALVRAASQTSTSSVEYMPLKETAKALKMTIESARNAVFQGTLQCALGPHEATSPLYLFDKAYIENCVRDSISIQEAMEMLGIDRQTINNLIESRDLAITTGMGGTVRFPRLKRSDIEYMKEKLK
jgi:hypothetical protein